MSRINSIGDPILTAPIIRSVRKQDPHASIACLRLIGMRAVLSLAMVAFVLPESTLALDPTKSISQYGHDVWDANRGFPYYAIHSIHQTRDNYLWLATNEGLVRFDGVKFTLFDKQNTPSMTANDVSALVEDSSGILWFGTRGGGLLRYQEGSITSYATDAGFYGTAIQSLYRGRDHELWVGSQSAGLTEIRDGRHRNFSLADISSVRTVYTIYMAQDGTLFLGSGGLFRRPSGSSTIELVPRQSGGFIRAILEDRSGTRWIGSDRGLFILDGDTTIPCREPGAPMNKPVTCLAEDRDGSLWVGTEGHGIFRRTHGTFTSFNSADGLSSSRILSLTEDRDGSIWIGTRGGGLNRLRDQSIKTLSIEDGLSGEHASTVLEDRDGTLWVGIRDRGVDEVRGDSVLNRYSFGSRESNSQIRALEEDRDGNILVGTARGLFVLEKPISSGRRIVKRHPLPERFERNPIRALLVDSDGSILIGFYGEGLWREKGGILTEILPEGYVRSLVRAPDGALWVGLKGSLHRFSTRRTDRFTTSDGLSSDEIFSIFCDNDETVWIGTYDGGLNRIKDGKITHLSKSQGLQDEVIYSILHDGTGSLWLSGNKGVFQVKKKDLNDVADGLATSVQPISYGVEDGMKSPECNGGSLPSGFRRQNGTLVFPTVRGVVMLDPARLRSERGHPPAVYIERIIVDEENTPLQSAPAVSAGSRKFEFQYTAVSFLAADRTTFRFQLEGFDDYWIQAGTRRSAYYTSLPAGSYTFRVQATDKSGAWTASTAAVSFVIPPLFWNTWWFRAGVALSLASLALYTIRWRERKIKQDAQQKMHLRQQLVELESRALRAQMNPHFLFNALNSIQECIVSGKSEAACEYLSKFANLIRIILENSEKPVVPLDREIEGLRLYLALESLRFDHQLDYRITVGEDLDVETHLIPPMLLQPYVENALWHGLAHKNAGRILLIDVRRTNDGLVCIVEDNGIGRDRAAALKNPFKQDHESKGMRVTRERLALMDVKSASRPQVEVLDLIDTAGNPGGTRVTISIPLQQAVSATTTG